MEPHSQPKVYGALGSKSEKENGSISLYGTDEVLGKS